MKTGFRIFLHLALLISVLDCWPTGRVTAQTFMVLHEFSATSNNASGQYTNSDGAFPYARLTVSGNTLYGTASRGGNSELGSVFTGIGTVFKVNTDGTKFTTLHHCAWGSDGAFPGTALVMSGSTLYGTTKEGGSGAGTLFAVKTDGTGYTNLRSFSWDAYPDGGLLLSGNTLYGTTRYGGPWTNGTVFAVNTDGTGFTNLHYFNGFSPATDGAFPHGGLILSGNTLYGTTEMGGDWGGGAVYGLSTDGTSYKNLHSFRSINHELFANEDGGSPQSELILSGNTLYGTTYYGGASGNGTVFKVNTDGTGFTNLHFFSAFGYTPVPPYWTNTDGGHPSSALILSGNTLYGTASAGGLSANGTVFALKTDGTGFTVLHTFTGGWDGAAPAAGLALSGNALYGTASAGGSFGNGTIFSISFAPQLTITLSGPNFVLTWPTNATGFTLQSTTNLASPAFWATNLPAPVVVNGQNTVTNPISGTQQFFRLSQ